MWSLKCGYPSHSEQSIKITRKPQNDQYPVKLLAKERAFHLQLREAVILGNNMLRAKLKSGALAEWGCRSMTSWLSEEASGGACLGAVLPWIHGRWVVCVSCKRRSAIERVTGRKARGLQMEEIGCKCQTFLFLLSGRRKQIRDIFFPSLYKFKRRFLLERCVATTPGFTWS